MSERIVSTCPVCSSDDLALVSEPDGDHTGTWTDLWFQCERCDHRLAARLVGWTYQPVEDDEENG